MSPLQFRALAGPAVALALLACSPAREHVEVSGPVELLANVPLSVKAPVPLDAPNYFNAICLLPESPKQLAQTPGFGFVAANGKAFAPNVALRNASGVEDPLPVVGGLGAADGLWVCFQSRGMSQSLHPPFTEVVLLSPEPLSLKAIKWHSSDK